MTWLIIHTPLYDTHLRKCSTVVGTISFAFSASFSTIYLWWKIHEPTPKGGRNQKWECNSSWQFSALFMIVMLELIRWDERRQTYWVPFCLLFSRWIEPAHRVAIITWRQTPRSKGDILSTVVVPPSSESPPPSFRDSRHPTSSFFSVDLMQKSDSELIHVKKWRDLMNWLFLLLFLILIIY